MFFCCFSELALYKSISACQTNKKKISLSRLIKVLAMNQVANCSLQQSLTRSLTKADTVKCYGFFTVTFNNIFSYIINLVFRFYTTIAYDTWYFVRKIRSPGFSCHIVYQILYTIIAWESKTDKNRLLYIHQRNQIQSDVRTQKCKIQERFRSNQSIIMDNSF